MKTDTEERIDLARDLEPVLYALGEMGASRMGILNHAEAKLFHAACGFLSWVETELIGEEQ